MLLLDVVVGWLAKKFKFIFIVNVEHRNVATSQRRFLVAQKSFLAKKLNRTVQKCHL